MSFKNLNKVLIKRKHFIIYRIPQKKRFTIIIVKYVKYNFKYLKFKTS